MQLQWLLKRIKMSINKSFKYETRGTLPGAPPFFSVDWKDGHGHSHYVSLFWCQPLLESKIEGYITDECYPATEEEKKHPEI